MEPFKVPKLKDIDKEDVLYFYLLFPKVCTNDLFIGNSEPYIRWMIKIILSAHKKYNDITPKYYRDNIKFHYQESTNIVTFNLVYLGIKRVDNTWNCCSFSNAILYDTSAVSNVPFVSYDKSCKLYKRNISLATLVDNFYPIYDNISYVSSNLKKFYEFIVTKYDPRYEDIFKIKLK